MENVNVMYMYSDAFTTCEKGHEIMLSQKMAGSRLYTGKCNECGTHYKLLNNKIKVYSPKTAIDKTHK